MGNWGTPAVLGMLKHEWVWEKGNELSLDQVEPEAHKDLHCLEVCGH